MITTKRTHIFQSKNEKDAHTHTQNNFVPFTQKIIVKPYQIKEVIAGISKTSHFKNKSRPAAASLYIIYIKCCLPESRISTFGPFSVFGSKRFSESFFFMPTWLICQKINSQRIIDENQKQVLQFVCKLTHPNSCTTRYDFLAIPN